MYAKGAAMVLAMSALLSWLLSCQARCSITAECSAHSYCAPETGRCLTDCLTDLDCRASPTPKGQYCNAYGRCVGLWNSDPHLAQDAGTSVPISSTSSSPAQGWDDPPASGRIFVIHQLAIADPNQGQGFNNALSPLSPIVNDFLAQGLLSGDTIILIEMAGIAQPYTGADQSVTLKFYSGLAAENSTVACCQFKIAQESLDTSPPQAHARIPAQIQRGMLSSVTHTSVVFTLNLGSPPNPEFRLDQLHLVAHISPAIIDNLSGGPGIDAGFFGGAIPFNSLASIPNPFCALTTCGPEPSTFLDLVSVLVGPSADVDLSLPPDGLEAVVDSGDGVALCCQAAGVGRPARTGQVCTLAQIPAIDASKPSTCAFNPAMNDGYSIEFSFSAVQASIVGVGE